MDACLSSLVVQGRIVKIDIADIVVEQILCPPQSGLESFNMLWVWIPPPIGRLVISALF